MTLSACSDMPTVQTHFSHMSLVPSARHKLNLPLPNVEDREGDSKPQCETPTGQTGGETALNTGPDWSCTPPPKRPQAPSSFSSLTALPTFDTLALITSDAIFCRGEVRHLALETQQHFWERPVPADLSNDDGHRYVMPMLLHNTRVGADVLHVVRKSPHEQRRARRWEPIANGRDR